MNAILLYRARGEVANKCMAEELERTSDSTSESATKSTKRGTYEKYTPKEKAETGCYAWYHSHNKASPSCLMKLCSNHENFNAKINNFANLECFTKFLCLKNLELYGISNLRGCWSRLSYKTYSHNPADLNH